MRNTEDLVSSLQSQNSRITTYQSDREQSHVQEFLKILGNADPISRRISPTLTVNEITGPNTKWLHAKNRRCVLLNWDDGTTSLPISVFFLSEGPKQLFGHCSLLTTTTKNNPSLLGRIAEATQNLFSGHPSELLSNLCTEWENEDFGGMIDKRMLWAESESSSVSNLIQKCLGKGIELPIFPSVFSFNNPYFHELINVTNDEISPQTKILAMGCGAGLEMAYFALKHGSSVDGVDINSIAVANAKIIARELRVDHLVRCWTSDAFSNVEKLYDLILLNAPLAINEARENDPNRFDPQGKFLKNILSNLENFLEPQGKLVLMSHPDLSEYIPNNLTYRVLKTFELKITLAFSEISRAG